MWVSRTRKAVAAVAAIFVMSGLLLLADPARATADSLWDGVVPTCTQSQLPKAPARGCGTDDSPWD